MILMGVAAAVQAEVVISDDFTIGNNDNTDNAEVAGTVTDVGNVTWRASASGKFRMNSAIGDGGGVINQNNLIDTSPRLYLDCPEILVDNNITTLSVKALAVDCRLMNFGFGTDDNLMSSSAHAFWARIPSNGVVDIWCRSDGANTRLTDSIQVKQTVDDVIEISLSYSQASNTVWGSIVGGKTTNSLAPTQLSFTPAFDQFNFELQNETGARMYAGYFDDVVVDIASLQQTSSYDSWAASFGLSGSPDADTDYDYDGDGFSNIYEFGLGGDPTNSAVVGTLPTFEVAGNVGSYVYPQLAAGQDSGLSYYLQTSTNLAVGGWTNAGYTVSGTNVTAGTLDFVTNRIPVDDPEKFIRLIIE